MEDDQPIESKMVSRSIASAQSQVEAQNFEIRKNVLKYDDVLNRQRTVIYDERRRVLEGEDLHEQMRFFVNDVVAGYVDAETSEGFAEDWDLDRLWTAVKALYPISLTQEQVIEAAGGLSGLRSETLKEEILSDAHHAYDAREQALGSEVMREVERRVMLSVLDRKWREHLYEMDYLQEGIGLRAMAQRDPLVEYQREGFQLWQAMNESVKEEAVGLIFHVDVQVDQPTTPEVATAPQHVSDMFGGLAGSDGSGDGTQEPDFAPSDAPRVEVAGVGVERPRQPAQLHYTAPSESGEVVERDVASGARSNGSGASGGVAGLSAEQLANTPRNASCPCGSGKKFKMCHGKDA